MRDSTPAPALISRDALRSRRKRVVRARTLNMVRLPKRELETGARLYPEPVEGRPRTRGECVDGLRPCPYVGCRYHLYLDVNPHTHSIKLNFPDLEPDELSESCALDVADRGGATLQEVGELQNTTRERARQIENRALVKLSRRASPLRDAAHEGFAAPDPEEP